MFFERGLVRIDPTRADRLSNAGMRRCDDIDHSVPLITYNNVLVVVEDKVANQVGGCSQRRSVTTGKAPCKLYDVGRNTRRTVVGDEDVARARINGSAGNGSGERAFFRDGIASLLKLDYGIFGRDASEDVATAIGWSC